MLLYITAYSTILLQRQSPVVRTSQDYLFTYVDCYMKRIYKCFSWLSQYSIFYIATKLLKWSANKNKNKVIYNSFMFVCLYMSIYVFVSQTQSHLDSYQQKVGWKTWGTRLLLFHTNNILATRRIKSIGANIL